MISIAMTTYNGEQFVIKQLDSIRTQSLLPDEVIICDDNSSDNTYMLIDNYIKKWNLNNWIVKRNNSNLGWKKNFYRALSMVKGDYVFFADQDDIWEENKVRIMVDEMKRNNIYVLCCTTSFIDSEDSPINISKYVLPYSSRKKNTINENRINFKFIYSIMPGCTMLICKELINKLKPFFLDDNFTDLPHDALFWKYATLERKAFVLNDDLIRYRIHTNNSSSPQTRVNFKPKSKQERIKENEEYINQIKKIKIIYSKLGGFEYIELLDDILTFCEKRKDIINKKNIFKAISQKKYYRNIKMLLGDLMAF